jgi:hypothetical protein
VGDDMYEEGSTRTGLKPKFYRLPNHGLYRHLPLQGKIPTAELGTEPGTSGLVYRSSDHQATRLIEFHIGIKSINPLKPDIHITNKVVNI